MWKFIKSSSSKDNWLDHNKKEICLIGRSNVGKSTLINSMSKNNKLAKTSKTPGRTQLINYFEIENGNIIVDLPGYGYANVSLSIQEKMFNMIDEYFVEHKPTIVLILIDSRIGVTKKDEEIIEYIQSLNHNVAFILTKTDKAKQKEIAAALKHEIFKNHQYFLSANNNENKISKIRDFIYSF